MQKIYSVSYKIYVHGDGEHDWHPRTQHVPADSASEAEDILRKTETAKLGVGPDINGLYQDLQDVKACCLDIIMPDEATKEEPK